MAVDDLRAVLADAQRYGFLGGRPIPDVIAHAQAFVAALDDVQGEVLDLGSGGGVPGLVIAHDRPDLQMTLLDRRAKRSDFLLRAIGRLGWSDRIAIAALDATEFARHNTGRFAAVVARGFGPPEVTLGVAASLTRPGGVIVVSEPPGGGDRWGEIPAVRSGAVARELGYPGVARFRIPG